MNIWLEVENREKVKEFIKSEFAEAIVKEDNFRDQDIFYIKPDSIFEICQAIYENDDLEMNYLSEITSLDWLGHEKEADGRFEVIYILYSLKHHNHIFLKVHLPESKPIIKSITSIFAGANWMEREVFDLMGIVFEGHPDLKKIVTADELEGHPLRKDFPKKYEVPVFSWNKDDPPEVIN